MKAFGIIVMIFAVGLGLIFSAVAIGVNILMLHFHHRFGQLQAYLKRKKRTGKSMLFLNGYYFHSYAGDCCHSSLLHA